MSEQHETRPGEHHTVIAANCRIDGDITIDGDGAVLGTVNGRVETTGNLLVGPEAEVRGGVVGQSIEVEGTVAGDVLGRGETTINGRVEGDVAGESVQIGAQAAVMGNLRAVMVAIAEGANYRGEVAIGPDALSEAAQEQARRDRESREQHATDSGTNDADPHEYEDASESPAAAVETRPARGAVSGLLRRRQEARQAAPNGARA